MPFFDIDADARFTTAISRLWIYGIIAGALTELTFAVSLAWDRLKWLHNQKSPANIVLEDEISSPLRPDDPVLEPVTSPEPDLRAAINQYWSEVNKMHHTKMETMTSDTMCAPSHISESSSGSPGLIEDNVPETSTLR